MRVMSIACVDCRLHLDEFVLAEKKHVANVNNSIDPATLSMASPDQALFSMDDPGSMEDFMPAAGGVMMLARDDNTLSAAQQQDEVTEDWGILRNAILGTHENSVNIQATNDATNKCADSDVPGRREGEVQKSAAAVECDENDVKHMHPKRAVEGSTKGNIVPFSRFKVPHSQA